MARVVVVGAGNGGAVTANLLSSKGLDVVVVDPSPQHVYQPGLLDLALGEDLAVSRPIQDVVMAPVLRDRARKVRVEDHSVLVGDKEIVYDYLVLAPGVESVEVPLPAWHTVDGALSIRERIRSFSGTKIVVGYWGVVKCPAAPFEMAFSLKLRYPKAEVTLLNPVSSPPELMRPMSEALGKRARELGVRVMRGFTVSRVDTGSRTIESESGERVEYDLALLDPPVKVGKEFKELAKGDFIPVDERLRYGRYDDVFVVGDANGLTFPPKTGGKAHYEAKVAAWNVLAKVNGWEERKYDGRAMCAIYGGGDGFLVRMDFSGSRVLGPNKAFKDLKRAFASLYWATLKGVFP
ncbi:hypothetical protein HS1genome_1828 [Sulfodiicoccus acidiphilus]|uniref:FAD/NAD(P)-binding domain-containing protein n=1 Tax=Sulfodiicoccus acidiphilus TaxID=1670455 RepID=A0A348B5I7_9CREN|nr:FAD/NAD(P)-binding oxidoreductase [Sulfodiicoccus acidiphilus]BBD73439.1 hypothetical protein HS1genome_1828 [Sulfodiicoccus acidiphilus]GGT98526.1 hypothetical protein GCM10007116_14910 [Sulfodiicoccus acidiphilus]